MASLEPVFEKIVKATRAYCRKEGHKHFDRLCSEWTVAFAHKKPELLAKGEAKAWAAAILHAIGREAPKRGPSSTHLSSYFFLLLSEYPDSPAVFI